MPSGVKYIIPLKVIQNEHLQKNGEGGVRSFPSLNFQLLTPNLQEN